MQRRDASDWIASFRSPNPPSASDIESALLDFGFYHPLVDVKRMYAEYVNNQRYGYAGGVLDQPDEYWHDIATMHWLALWDEHVKSMPRLAPVSVFTTLKKTGKINGTFIKPDERN